MKRESGRWIGALVLAAWIGAGALGAAEPVPLTPQQHQEMAKLARAARGPDPDASAQALRDLEALGEPARPRLLNVVKELLLRDKPVVTAATRRIGDLAKAKAAAAELAGLRKAALENLAKLDKGETLRLARENYDRLADLLRPLNETFAVRRAVRAVMARRPALYAAWERLGGSDPRLTPANEDQLRQDAAAILGMPVADALAVPEFGPGGPPADPLAREYWFYDACRKIEACNRAQEPLMSPAEAENVALLNAYREGLGILPLEADPRLLQSARRHSKEMADKGYFAHESPTPSEKTHADRMRNAGYPSGFSENIADGARGGKGTFWMWFDSPPHHKNMVHAASTAMGVGQWGSKWTQNFGTGPRLVVLTPLERLKHPVKGEILPPQGSGPRRR